MNQKEIIEVLKHEATKNEVVGASLLLFSERERARYIVTINGLYQSMRKHGFEYKRHEYVQVLQLLARLGLGKLEIDHKGRIRALKDINTTLASIGKAASENSTTLEQFKQKRRYRSLVTRATSKLSLVLTVNNKPVHLKLPKDLTPEELSGLISRLSNIKKH